MVKEREINLEGHTELVDALDFCPTKNYLLSGSKDTTVRLWDVEKKDLKKIFRKHQKQVCAARWLQENKFASAGFDKCIKICDTETGKVVSDFKDRDWILDLKVNPRDKNLLLVCGAKGICSLWDVRRKEAVFQAKEPEGRSWGSLNFTVDWDPYNTDHYAVGNGAGSITIWDKRKLKAESVKNFETDYGAINSLAFNPVVKNVIVAAYLIWQKKNSVQKSPGLLLFFAHLLLNPLWIYLFFVAHNLQAAAALIVGITICAWTILYLFKKESEQAAYWFLPYCLWISYAAALSVSYYLNN
jgi:hypothetical protein